MILTVSMKAHRRQTSREGGLKPDFNRMFEGYRGVRLLSVIDNGRCAKIDVDDGGLDVIERKYSQDFVFSGNVKFEPFAP